MLAVVVYLSYRWGNIASKRDISENDADILKKQRDNDVHSFGDAMRVHERNDQ